MGMKFSAMAAAGLLAWVLPASAQIYSGMLGTLQVVMELQPASGKEVRQGRYFYRHQGVDIPLKGQADDLLEGLPLDAQTLSQLEQSAAAGQTVEPPVFKDLQGRSVHWQGQVQGDEYRGTWRDDRRGRSHPFVLKRVTAQDAARLDAGRTPLPANPRYITATTQLYEFLRLSVPLKQGQLTTVVPGLAWRLVQDRRTQFWFPRLARHPDAQVMARVNALLEQQHWAMNLDALGCKSSQYQQTFAGAGTLAGYEKHSVRVTYLSPSLMSVLAQGSTVCGGPPQREHSPMTFDLRRGEPLDFSRIFTGVDGAQYTQAFAEYVKSLQGAPGVVDDDTGCADDWPAGMTLYFKAPAQLAVATSLSNGVQKYCLATHMTVPLSRLRPLLRPGAGEYLPDLRRQARPAAVE